MRYCDHCGKPILRHGRTVFFMDESTLFAPRLFMLRLTRLFVETNYHAACYPENLERCERERTDSDSHRPKRYYVPRLVAVAGGA